MNEKKILELFDLIFLFTFFISHKLFRAWYYYYYDYYVNKQYHLETDDSCFRSMSSVPMQLVATKCPTDELSFTNSAVINEKDIDPKHVR